MVQCPLFPKDPGRPPSAPLVAGSVKLAIGAPRSTAFSTTDITTTVDCEIRRFAPQHFPVRGREIGKRGQETGFERGATGWRSSPRATGVEVAAASGFDAGVLDLTVPEPDVAG